jgi:hypothetical protein
VKPPCVVGTKVSFAGQQREEGRKANHSVLAAKSKPKRKSERGIRRT